MSEPTTIRGPREVLATLPYLLGYRPERSVVLVSLHGTGLGPVARLDLPDPRNVRVAVDALVAPVLRAAPDRALVIGYEDRRGESTAVTRALVRALECGGVEVVEELVVRGERWYAPRCRRGCCPRGGRRLPRAEDVPAVADLVAVGRAPLPSRDALAGLVAPDPARGEAVLAATTTLRRGGPALGDVRAGDLWARLVDVSDAAPAVQELTPAEVARLAVSLDDRTWRDGLVWWMCPEALPAEIFDDGTIRSLLDQLGPPRPRHRRPAPSRARRARLDRVPAPRAAGPVGARPATAPSGEDASVGSDRGSVEARDRLRQRLLDLCRAVPDSCPAEAAAVCTVAACVAWGHGDGAVARDAVDRALRLRPDHRLARLVHHLVDLGVPPDADRRRAG
jgi:hypothetical protein